MIRAVGRALAIFDAYDNAHLSLSLQEIAERIRMPKTTAFRLVNTLEGAGFLIRLDNQRYCLSLKLARLGGLVRSTLNIRDIARPIMLQVNEQVSETITLNAIVGNDRMVLDVVDTPSPLMSMARPGEHQPLLLGASGRIMMAYMKAEELESVLAANAPKDFDRGAFDREIARIRRQGYAITRGQRVAGLTAIALPIFDLRDEVRYCLSLTGPSVRVDPRDHELAEIMITAGRDISSRLGASPENAVDQQLLAADEARSTAERAAAKKPAAKVVGKPAAKPALKRRPRRPRRPPRRARRS
ncbi:MAG: IclR family transcriptional regulator [Rubrivivax sp.]